MPNQPDTIEVRSLEPSDERGTFGSGDPDLDSFFHKYAGQNQFRYHIGTTYVAVAGESVAGYATVSSCHISVDDLPKTRRKRLPRYPLPVLRLARLAVDRAFRGKGIGLALLKAVFTIAREMEELTGCVGVVVDAEPGAVEFYRRFGFEEIGDVLEGECHVRPTPIPMFLPLGRIP